MNRLLKAVVRAAIVGEALQLAMPANAGGGCGYGECDMADMGGEGCVGDGYCIIYPDTYEAYRCVVGEAGAWNYDPTCT